MYFREIGLLYKARLRGDDPPLPEFQPLQYADYAAWQRRDLRPDGDAYRQAVAWWVEQFSPPPPTLELPFRRPTPCPEADPHEALIWWDLAPEVSKHLERIGREEGATYYVIRLAAFVALLADTTGQPDVVIGTYVSNRNRVELQNMFGLFANLTTLRFHCDPRSTFREWVSTVRKKVGDIQAQAEIPYEQLCNDLRLQGVTPPEIRAIFTVADHTGTMRFGGLELTCLDRRIETMPWGFSLNFDQHNELQRCRATFDATAYDPTGVRELIGRFLHLLDVASASPDLRLSELLVKRASAGFNPFPAHAA